MSLTASVDLSQLRARMSELAAVAHREMKDVVRQQAALTISHPRSGIIAITPPSSDKARGPAAKKAGESNVERDIMRVYGTPSDLWLIIRDKAGRGIADNFWAYVKLKRWAQANAIAQQYTGQRLLLSLTGREHQMRRNARTGRVTGKGKSAYVSEPKLRDNFIKKKQGYVGLRASGWCQAANAAGLPTRGVPAWVKRHARSNGSARPVETADSYSLTLGNTTPYGGDADDLRRLKSALSYRLSNMKKDIRRTIERAAKATA